MTLRRYERYKDSGVEWLGAVPEHWEVMPLSRITRNKCDGPFGSGIKSDHYTEAGALVVRLQNIRAEGFFVGERAFIDQTYFEQQLIGHEVLAGDVLIAGLGDDNNLVGRACVAPAGLGPSLVKADCFRFRIDSCKASPHFVAAQLTAAARSDAGRLSTGSTRSRIPLGTMASRSICLPTLDEQQAIVHFLERENFKIDTLIAEQQRLIELLTEKRQAVIAQAVTKGLNSSAPMKDSGVEWLGKVPAHWAVQPLKHVADFRSGGTPDKSNLDFWDGMVPWASAKDLKVDDLFDTADHITDEALASGAASLVPVNSVLVVVRGMILARMFPVVTARVPMAINQDLKAVAPRAPMDGEYLAWLLRASAAESLSRLDEAGHGTKALRMDAWGAMRVPLPPLVEQRQIATHLKHACSMADAGLDDVRLGIALLRERRTALISAAVTGQIDVRDQPSLDTDLAQTRVDIAAGRYVVESAAAHVARLQAMASADEPSAPPPAPC